MRSAEDGNGYQAWQALLRARTARNATNLLNQLLEPSPDPRINLRQWNKNAEEHATRTSERVSDGIRRAVYMKKIAPQDMRQHLMLNQSRLSTAEELPRKLKITGMQPRNFRVMTRTKLPLIKAMRKVENLMERHATLERVVAQKGKGKMHK